MRSSGPILISLGSNVEPERHMRAALAALDELSPEALTVVARSRVYVTAPVHTDPDAPDFLNAVVQVETDRSPSALKYDVLRPLEARLGRVRDPFDKAAPRRIDLDLVLYGDVVQEREPGLPDRGLVEDAYVAIPAAELAPEFVHPLTGRTLAEHAAALDGTGVLPVELRLDPSDEA